MSPFTACDRIRLVTDDPAAFAEQCWDAGFEIRLGGPAGVDFTVVIEPLQLEVHVVLSEAKDPLVGRNQSRSFASLRTTVRGARMLAALHGEPVE